MTTKNVKRIGLSKMQMLRLKKIKDGKKVVLKKKTLKKLREIT